jgi:hypothetical protein
LFEESFANSGALSTLASFVPRDTTKETSYKARFV